MYTYTVSKIEIRNTLKSHTVFIYLSVLISGTSPVVPSIIFINIFSSYKILLNRARQFELENHDVILCTCTAASNPNFTMKLALHQIIIDECAMATEPEAFIPLSIHKPKQVCFSHRNGKLFKIF